jgi:hypothetical protein
MTQYEIITAEDGMKSFKKTTEDGTVWWLPFDPANTDYQAYLKWVAEGNTPEPAENT